MHVKTVSTNAKGVEVHTGYGWGGASRLCFVCLETECLQLLLNLQNCRLFKNTWRKFLQFKYILNYSLDCDTDCIRELCL